MYCLFVDTIDPKRNTLPLRKKAKPKRKRDACTRWSSRSIWLRALMVVGKLRGIVAHIRMFVNASLVNGMWDHRILPASHRAPDLPNSNGLRCILIHSVARRNQTNRELKCPAVEKAYTEVWPISQPASGEAGPRHACTTARQ